MQPSLPPRYRTLIPDLRLSLDTISNPIVPNSTRESGKPNLYEDDSNRSKTVPHNVSVPLVIRSRTLCIHRVDQGSNGNDKLLASAERSNGNSIRIRNGIGRRTLGLH